MKNIIEVNNVSFEYITDENTLKAIDNLDLQVKEGEFVAIIGHNGSGKSTLSKNLNAILFPTEGNILINKMDTREEDKLWDIRQTAGMVFQNPDNQIVATIVEEDVAFWQYPQLQSYLQYPFLLQKKVWILPSEILLTGADL